MPPREKRSVKAELIEQIGDGTYTTRNHELERKVLKQIFARPDQIGLISATLTKEHFTDPRYRDIYEKALTVYKQGKIRKSDITVVIAECLRNPSDEIEPEDYRAAAEEINREDRDVELDLAMVTLNNLMLARKLQGFSHDVISKASSGEDISSLISDASNQIRGISASSSLEDNCLDLDKILEEQEFGITSLVIPSNNAIQTPFPLLNDMIKGFRPGDVYVVGGRPGMGKTALLLQCAYYAASIGNYDLFYAHEMSKEQMWMRLMCNYCNVSNSDVERNELTEAEQDRCNEWYRSNPAKKFLHFNEKGGKTPMQIRSDVIKFKEKRGDLKIVFVDYLQLMHSGMGHRDKREEVSYISTAMKEIAKDLNVAVVLASSMNRDFERRQGKTKRPELSDLNESGQIEADASVVLFPHRPSMYDQTPNQNPPPDELVIRKNRHGATGIVPVNYVGQCFRFESLPEKRVV